MKTENCREWRTALGAYVLGDLPADERAGLEAHLEGCGECRAEMRSLAGVARLLPHADPARFGPAPAPAPELGERIAAAIGEESHAASRRRRRFGLALGGAVAVATAVLAILVLPLGGGGAPQRQVQFAGLPAGVEISATLEPRAYGTEIHMYVDGMLSGTLCRVFLRGRDGSRVAAGTFRYRWGNDSGAVLSSALDLSRTAAIGLRADGRVFTAPVGDTLAAAGNT